MNRANDNRRFLSPIQDNYNDTQLHKEAGNVSLVDQIQLILHDHMIEFWNDRWKQVIKSQFTSDWSPVHSNHFEPTGVIGQASEVNRFCNYNLIQGTGTKNAEMADQKYATKNFGYVNPQSHTASQRNIKSQAGTASWARNLYQGVSVPAPHAPAREDIVFVGKGSGSVDWRNNIQETKS